MYYDISESRLDIFSNGKCKPKFGFEKLVCSGCGLIKFIYSEKPTKFCEIFPLLLTVFTAVKSKGKISQNFVAFSEYMNFMRVWKVEQQWFDTLIGGWDQIENIFRD